MASSIKSGSLAADQSISTGSAHASSNAIFKGALGSSSTWTSSPEQGSASLFSSYALSDGMAASEISSASSDQIGISNTRSISGIGNYIDAYQTYSGSEGYDGIASFTASGSGSLTASAFLDPKYMTASQNIAASGGVAEAETSVNNRGSSAGVASSIKSGSLAADQSI